MKLTGDAPARWLAALALALMVVGGAVLGPGFGHASPAAPAPDAAFLQRVSTRLAEVRRAEGGVLPAGGVVLTGSSSIAGWASAARDLPGRRVVNLGLGGSTLAQHAGSVAELVGPFDPRVVVVYAGANDLQPGRAPASGPSQVDRLATAARGYFDALRRAAPRAHIFYVEIIESPAKAACREDVAEANRRLRALADADDRVTFVPMNDALAGPDGRPQARYFRDGLHLTPEGYRLFAGRIAAALAAGS